MFYSMYLSSKWFFVGHYHFIRTALHPPRRYIQCLTQPEISLPQATTNPDLRNRSLRTPTLVVAALRALSNPAWPLLQSPRQQPRIQHRCAVQIGRSCARRRSHQGVYDLPQLQRQRRHVPWPTSRQRWRSARTASGHWRRQSDDS